MDIGLTGHSVQNGLRVEKDTIFALRFFTILFSFPFDDFAVKCTFP